MASGTLILTPDIADSWLFRQLRPAPTAPVVKAKARPVEVAVEAVEEIPEVLTLEQEAKILAHAAREFESDFNAVLDSLNNIHGRSFDDVSEAFSQRLDSLALALELEDFESARADANRLNLVLSEMQANIPAWHYVRGLQLLVRRCSKLGL
jgi:hypothetical protein